MNYQTKLAALGFLPFPLRRAIMTRRYAKDVASGERELRELGKFVNRNGLVIDVGCNYGVYAYALSRLAKQVVAFEPNPDLARFVARLRLPRLEVRQLALSSRDGGAELTIVDGLHQQASLRSPPVSEGAVTTLTVPTATLDSLEFYGVQFIKIDVEGFEEQTLAGATKTIAREMPHVLIEIEERHNPGGLDRIRCSLSELGYRCLFLHQGEWRSADHFRADLHQRLGDRTEGSDAGAGAGYVNNFLFAPPSSKIAKSAP